MIEQSDLSPIVKEAMLVFADERTKRGKPATVEAMKRSIAKIKKLSNGDDDLACEIINQSIEAGWTALFDIKGQYKKTTKQEVEYDVIG